MTPPAPSPRFCAYCDHAESLHRITGCIASDDDHRDCQCDDFVLKQEDERLEEPASVTAERDALAADRDQWQENARMLGQQKDELERRLAEAERERDALKSLATDVTNCHECFVYTVNGGYPIPDDGQPEPKREEDYDEYDYMMAPKWKALTAALAAPTTGGKENGE